ncbi:MAG: CRTAC1 family protein [Bacteriovoracaceae bacterium]|nr:CRTAC1 family protein [Bacteriovoracaceae bacterium]
MKKFAGILTILCVFAVGQWIRSHQYFIGAKDFTIDEEAINFFSRPLFKDITAQTGLSFENVRAPVDPMLYHRIDSFFVSPGIAIADFNQDGLQDVFFPSTSPTAPNKLYLNQGKNKFEEQALKWGIQWNTSGHLAGISATAVDLDNDGRSDLILTGMGCTHVWMNKKNKFENNSKLSGLGDCQNALAAIPFDINNDGWLDIYLLRYWGPHDMFKLDTPHIYVNNLYNADNGGKNSFFLNQKNGSFIDSTKEIGGDDPHWSYDATIADFDLDGNYDVYISNDYGPDKLYSIVNGKMIDTSSRFEVPDRRYGMNASLGDLDHNQKPHIYVSNAYDGPPYGLTGNFLWKVSPTRAKDFAYEKNVQNCGFAWGSAFVDFNLDGYEDLYVANGFISTSTPQASRIPRNLDQNANLFNMLQIRTLPGEFSSDIRNWISFVKGNGLHHQQRDCLFMNYKNKFMVDMAEKHGLDPLLSDNRSTGVVDLDNDGDQDLVITSRNGPVFAWENLTNPESSQWIGFSLTPSRENPNPGGARVTVEQEGVVQTRWQTSGRNGFLASSDTRLVFGLNKKSSLKVKVYWRDGTINEWTDLQAGKYHELSKKNQLR